MGAGATGPTFFGGPGPGGGGAKIVNSPQTRPGMILVLDSIKTIFVTDEKSKNFFLSKHFKIFTFSNLFSNENIFF